MTTVTRYWQGRYDFIRSARESRLCLSLWRGRDGWVLVEGDAIKVAEQYRKAVEERVGVTLSIGVASSIDLSDEDNKAVALLKKADERMNKAKKSGKSNVVSVDRNEKN